MRTILTSLQQYYASVSFLFLNVINTVQCPLSTSQTRPTNSHKTVISLHTVTYKHIKNVTRTVKHSNLITLKSYFLLNTFMAERDAIRSQMKPSRYMYMYIVHTRQ